MHSLTKSMLLVLLLGTIVGCRTYGGYGSEEALYRQIQRATEEFAQEFEQMRQAQPDLEAQLRSVSGSEQMTVTLGTAISLHGRLLEEHREMVENLSESSSHRALSRAYGAIISDQQVVRRLYRRAQEQSNPAGMRDGAGTESALQTYNTSAAQATQAEEAESISTTEN